MTPSEKADANLIEALRSYARWQTPCELQERDGLLLMAGATRFPASCINAAIRTDTALTPQQALARAREFFAAHERGFTFVTRDSCDADLAAVLTAEKLSLDSDSPCMLIEAPAKLPATPNGIHIETLREPCHVADITAISAQAYEALGLPSKQTQAVFSRINGVLDNSVTAFIAYRDQQPVATAITVFSGAGNTFGAGIYWVGTVPTARGMGLAELCTALATNVGFERGANMVTLQASVFGEPIYRRMGYRDYDRLRWFRHAAPMH